MKAVEYEALALMLRRFETTERSVLDSQHHGSVYLQYVEEELFTPLRRVIELVDTRAKQVKESELTH